MTPIEIEERLILAAEIEEFGERVGPERLKAFKLPYIHTAADKAGWNKKRGDRECQLKAEDADALAAERREFFDGKMKRPTARQFSEAEEAWGWYALVDGDDNRAALAGWARCMARHEQMHFKDWCRRNGIHEETGRRRKNRAIGSILAKLARRTLQNNETAGSGVLPETPEISDKCATVEECAPDRGGFRAWGDDSSFQPIVVGIDHDFSWAEKRNEIRRQREARKRKQEAA